MSQTDSFMLRPFAESLDLNQYIDPMVDIGDITLGAMLSEDSVFKDVPIIRSLRVLNNVRLTIQGAFEIKNQLVFCREFKKENWSWRVLQNDRKHFETMRPGFTAR